MKLSKSRWIQIIVAFVVFQSALISYLWIDRKQTLANHSAFLEQRLEEEFHTALGFHQEMAANTVLFSILNENVFKLFEKYDVENHYENRTPLRQEIYRELKPVYERLKDSNFRQIHFHLKDGTSLLRMHLPGKYGDYLFDVRPELKEVRVQQKQISTFSIGKHFHAFRYIFPIKYHQRFYGSVEASVSFRQFKYALTQAFEGEFLLIVPEKELWFNLSPDFIRNYEQLQLDEPYWIEKEDLPSNDHLLHQGHLGDRKAKSLISLQNKKVSKLLKTKKKFHVYTDYQKKKYFISFIPIQNFKNEFSAYAVILLEDHFVNTLNENYIMFYLIASIMLIFALGIYFYYTGKLIKNINFLHYLLDSIPIPVFIKNASGQYSSCNKAYEDSVGKQANDLVGKRAIEGFSLETAEMMEEQDQLAFDAEGQSVSFETKVALKEDTEMRHFVVYKRTYKNEEGRTEGLIGAAIEVTELKNQETKQAKLIEELQTALDEVKTLQGIIPICSYCRNLKDDAGTWKKIEDYLSSHSDAQLSHGICEPCMRKHFPEFLDEETTNEPDKS